MRRLTLTSLLLLLLIAGCRRQPAAPQPRLMAHADAEGCHFTVHADRDNLDLTDTLRLSLQIRVPSGASCQFDGLAENLTGFRPRPPAPTTCVREGDGTLYTQILEVEPLLDDSHILGPFTATVTFQDAPDDAPPVRLASPPFAVDVRMPPDDVWQTLDIDDRTAMNPIRSAWLYLLPGAMAMAMTAVIAGLLAFFLNRHRRTTPQPPHLAALRRLDELLAERLPERGQAKLFYQRLSELLRTYIEERFAIRAPRQTTEEFLHRLSIPDSPLEPYRNQLQVLLQFCDLVKFAELAPSDDDIRQTTDACRAFITATVPEENPHAAI